MRGQVETGSRSRGGSLPHAGQGERLRFAEVGMTNSDYMPDGTPKPGMPPVQLYDLDADPGETKNVSSENPEVVSRLKKLFGALARSGRNRS